jgi:hypothetical protein
MKILKFCLLIFLCNSLHAQTKPEIAGYVSAMPSAIWMSNPQDVQWQAPLHNRLNAGWQFAKNWRIDAGMRNRFIIDKDMTDPASAAFDRLYLTFEHEKWKLQLGRQRINWGQTFVWNPNDIFNTYSFFDFDYPERPGCDAFRATYFHSETASSELAASINRDGKITAALLHHWNYRNFDYQLIVGEQAESDIIAGGAWTGDFNGLNFRGEFSVFIPTGDSRLRGNEAATVAASAGADYLFSNSLMLQAEALYNNVNFSGAGLMGLYDAPLSAKTLSICDWNLFAQASYPLTPRLNTSLSGMYFIDINAYYAGFNIDYSLAENLDLSLIAQYFAATGGSPVGNMNALLGFTRIKYSF